MPLFNKNKAEMLAATAPPKGFKKGGKKDLKDMKKKSGFLANFGKK
jgi:hypothetical protein